MDETGNLNELEKQYAGEAPSTEFASLLEQSESQMDHKEIMVGQRVPGKVQKIDGSSTFVDFGGRSEAVIDTQELRDREGVLQYAVGDTIEAFVASMEGEVRLTMSLRGGSNTEILREAYENGIPVEGPDLDLIRGLQTLQIKQGGGLGGVATDRILEGVGKDGGYIASPAHDVPGDSKTENIIAMLEVLQNQ